MKKYLVVVEETETGYSAYSPDFARSRFDRVHARGC